MFLLLKLRHQGKKSWYQLEKLCLGLHWLVFVYPRKIMMGEGNKQPPLC